MSDIGPYAQDVLTRIYNVQWEEAALSRAVLSFVFSATPTGFYRDGTPTVATLSVEGLPLLSPSTFTVNWPKGFDPPPFFPAAYYGGNTELTMPDGESGTLTANWLLEQQPFTGTAFGEVNYDSSTTPPGKPFLGANKIKIKVVMNLRPLDFLSSSSADNHYEWQASTLVTIPGMPLSGSPAPKSGRAETGATLTFILDVIMDPPSATFTAVAG